MPGRGRSYLLAQLIAHNLYFYSIYNPGQGLVSETDPSATLFNFNTLNNVNYGSDATILFTADRNLNAGWSILLRGSTTTRWARQGGIWTRSRDMC